MSREFKITLTDRQLAWIENARAQIKSTTGYDVSPAQVLLRMIELGCNEMKTDLRVLSRYDFRNPKRKKKTKLEVVK